MSPMSRVCAIAGWRGAMALALVSALVAAGCGDAGSAAASGSKLTVATTTTVFADMVRQIGGADVEVESLVPPNGDVHTFSPTPSHARLLSRAGLVVMNGLGLDDWLDGTVADVGTKATVLKLGVDLPGANYLAGDNGETANPHLWMDVTYAKAYAARITEALAVADPPHAATYRANGDAYAATLDRLDAWVRGQIAAIPEVNRRFVSFHDAFPYFARRYGLQIVGVAVEAPGQDPSAGYTAQLIQAIREAHVKAIFSEAQFPPKLVNQLASETGATVVANLYDDSIGDPPVTTYEAIIRWDTDQFVKALS
jgi:ABC-type Zn uptake system ZnuABC Zn-binding protein ZnuA